MSPRRMDISSLLRDPSPPTDTDIVHTPRPRTIDALLHHPPSSLLSLLNSPAPRPSLSPHRPSSSHHSPALASPPFLGLDALVHVASEERRRITAHDHDWPSRHYHDTSRPHKRARDTPSPEPRFPPLTSPSIRLHSSASPITNYPTLRRQFVEPSPCRSVDTRTHIFLPLQSPTPPLHFRSHPLSSPTHDPDAMSPRFNLGPRMAGGIQVLSGDSPPLRDATRPDFSNYPESRHDRHDLPRSFSPLDDPHHHHQVEPAGVRLQSRPLHFPPHPPMDNTRCTSGPNSPDRPPPERHPIRVWEEEPTSRRVPVLSDGPSYESGHLAMQGRWSESQHNVPGIAPSPPSPMESLSHAPIPEPLTSISRTPIKGKRINPQLISPTPMQPRSPLQSESQSPLPETTLTPPAPASPVLDLHTEIQPHTPVDASTSTSSETSITEPKIEQTQGAMDSDILVVNSSPRQPSPEPVPATESGTSEVSMYPTHATVSQGTSRSPSQQSLSILLPTKDEHSPSPEDVPITPSVPPELSPQDIPTTPFIPPEPSPRRSPEPACTSEQKLPVLEQTMMDVDEELLSLVEDRPVRTVPTPPSKVKVGSKSTLPGQCTSAGAERASIDGPSLVLPSQPVLKGPLLIIDEEKDRASMPPPAARNKKAEKDKIPGGTSGSKKKKESKTAAKPKQPPKPKPKPPPKSKPKPSVVESSLKPSVPKGPVNVNARSRSTSVLPGAVDDIVPDPDAENSDKEDDKLYCVCKTRYDEDRMMIACDRCDEWFHTLCVNMPDLEIDLVDQFICPPCIQKQPHLRTTWKRRCLFGLRHESPLSLEACHKPSRGAFSKYCSDDCGIKYMRGHIAQWEKSGGVRDLLWESVKHAPKREGVVVCATTNGKSPPRMINVDGNGSAPKPLDSAAKRRAEREVARLNARLEEVVRERELMKREFDMVMWREKVVELASERAGKVDECGWDQRLCFGEEEWADFGPEVLESYEEARVKVESGDDVMPLDAASAMQGEWWCTGKKKCERHAGWQKLRTAEVSFDKETKEGTLLKLTTREREIRKSIEDILYPQPNGTLQAPSKRPPLEIQLNGN